MQIAAFSINNNVAIKSNLTDQCYDIVDSAFELIYNIYEAFIYIMYQDFQDKNTNTGKKIFTGPPEQSDSDYIKFSYMLKAFEMYIDPNKSSFEQDSSDI